MDALEKLLSIREIRVCKKNEIERKRSDDFEQTKDKTDGNNLTYLAL